MIISETQTGYTAEKQTRDEMGYYSCHKQSAVDYQRIHLPHILPSRSRQEFHLQKYQMEKHAHFLLLQDMLL